MSRLTAIDNVQQVTHRRLVSLAVVALLARVSFTVAFMRDYTPKSDADSYYSIARSLARGDGFVHTLPFGVSHATAIRPPLYPAVVSIAFRVFGSHVGVAQAVNVAVGTAAVLLGAILAARIAGPSAGFSAGLVLALYPPLLANDTTVLVESLAVLLTFACVLALADGRTVLAATALGLLMLDRASAQWLVPLLGAWVLWRFGWRHATRFALVTLLIVAPWVVRNAVDVGGPVLVTTNGFNLNALYSSEASNDKGFVDAYFDPRFVDIRLNASDEVDLDNSLRSPALDEVRSHPARIARVVATNTLQWFEIQPRRNHDPETFDGRNLGVRDWTLPGFYVISAAGLVGLFLARRRAAAQLLLIFSSYFTVICIGSVAAPRLRSVFDACMALGAGLAIEWVRRRETPVREIPARRPIRVGASIVALTLGFAVVGGGGASWRAHMQNRARHLLVSAISRDAGALRSLEDAMVHTREEPTRYPARSTAALGDLAQALVGSTSDAPPRYLSQVVAASRAVRLAQHEVDVVGLLSAAEYLHPRRARPSIETVRRRYEQTVRPRDSSLPPWNVVASGRSLAAARAAVGALEHSLLARRPG